MTKFGFENGRSVEYLILANPRPDGPVIGLYLGRSIASAVIDYFGRRYVFSGIASRKRNGQYDVDGLTRGERLVEPGLVYCYDRDTPPSARNKPAPQAKNPLKRHRQSSRSRLIQWLRHIYGIYIGVRRR